MANISLGKVTVASAGTPQQVISTQTQAHSYLVQALSTNTGKVYIGSKTMVKSTLVGVFAVLAAPTTNLLPSFASAVSYSSSHFDLQNVYLDVDNSGEGALVSIVQA